MAQRDMAPSVSSWWRGRGWAGTGLAALALIAALAGGGTLLVPRDGLAQGAVSWQAPDLRPVEQRYLAAAAAYSQRHGGAAMVVLHDGRMVFESYASQADRDTPRPIASGTKSFWGVAALAAVADGLMSLDEPVANTLTEWARDPQRRAITVRDLLTFTSGLSPGYRDLRRSADIHRAALNVGQVAQPGALFTYGPSHLSVFGAFLDRKLGGRERPLAYLKRRILDPIGLRVGDWRTDGQGHATLAAGASLTASEWAKFGQLLANQGGYDGRQIIPAPLMADLTRPSRVNPRYGLTVWLNNPLPAGAEARIKGIRDIEDIDFSGGVPGDLFMAAGKGDHRLYVIPSLRLVVVRLSGSARGDSSWRDGTFMRLLLTGSE